MEETERLLTSKECAEILSVSFTTFWRHVNNGALPAPVSFGTVRRWRKSDLDAFIAARGVQSKNTPAHHDRRHSA